MPRLVYIVTHPITARVLLRAQLARMRERGFEVVIVAPPGEELEAVLQREGVGAKVLPMEREICPIRDLIALVRLYILLRSLRPDIVNAGTPKGGFLGMLAARLAGVPVRIYTLRGLRLETARGLKRLILRTTERLACRCAHRVICVSESLQQRAIGLDLVDPQRTIVLASGSSNGVDPDRYAPSAESLLRAAKIRRALRIPDQAPVVGFMGRFTRDKGIVELIEAFRWLKGRLPEVRLLLLGGFEDGDPVPAETRSTIESDPQIIWPGWIEDPSDYFHVLDVLTLPTYREGFGNVVLEAAAAAKPVVATRATGVVDAVVDGVTGILVPVGDGQALGEAIARLLEDKALAARMGFAGRERVEREFRRERVWTELEGLYRDMLRERGLSVPKTRAVVTGLG